METKSTVSVELELTVFFEDPFWVGVFQRTCNGKLEVAKITFGSEPKDQQIYDFILHQWQCLRFSSPTVWRDALPKTKVNPKRLQRQAKQETLAQGIGTKAQQALQQQREANKQAKHTRQKKAKEEDEKRRFQQKQQKKKEKHKGK